MAQFEEMTHAGAMCSNSTWSEECKSSTKKWGKRAIPMRLFSFEAELAGKLGVALFGFALEILEELAALGDHLEESTA